MADSDSESEQEYAGIGIQSGSESDTSSYGFESESEAEASEEDEEENSENEYQAAEIYDEVVAEIDDELIGDILATPAAGVAAPVTKSKVYNVVFKEPEPRRRPSSRRAATPPPEEEEEEVPEELEAGAPPPSPPSSPPPSPLRVEPPPPEASDYWETILTGAFTGGRVVKPGAKVTVLAPRREIILVPEPNETEAVFQDRRRIYTKLLESREPEQADVWSRKYLNTIYQGMVYSGQDARQIVEITKLLEAPKE